jgi:hypothetical protein
MDLGAVSRRRFGHFWKFGRVLRQKAAPFSGPLQAGRILRQAAIDQCSRRSTTLRADRLAFLVCGRPERTRAGDECLYAKKGQKRQGSKEGDDDHPLGPLRSFCCRCGRDGWWRAGGRGCCEEKGGACHWRCRDRSLQPMWVSIRFQVVAAAAAGWFGANGDGACENRLIIGVYSFIGRQW